LEFHVPDRRTGSQLYWTHRVGRELRKHARPVNRNINYFTVAARPSPSPRCRHYQVGPVAVKVGPVRHHTPQRGTARTQARRPTLTAPVPPLWTAPSGGTGEEWCTYARSRASAAAIAGPSRTTRNPA